MTKDTDQKTGLSKTCTKCGEKKSVEGFNKDRSKKDGLSFQCRECHSARLKKSRQENPQKQKEYSDRWKEKNPESAKESAKRSRANRKEVAKEEFANWLARNPNYFIEYRRENKERRADYNREWRKNNPEATKRHARTEYENNRTTIAARLSASIKAGIAKTIKSGSKGNRKWESLVGYTVDELRSHLELQFLPGMTWDNYGDWHIDHVVPLSAHNYETPEDIDFKRAWALSNLAPLWAIDNMKKGAKVSGSFQPSLALSIPPAQQHDYGAMAATT